MMPKLKCVILDDDKFMVEMLNDLCKDIPFVKVTNSFDDSKAFLDSLPGLDFDVALLDISMPGKDGLFIAQQIKEKQVIFVTGQDDMLRDAHSLSPMGIIMKPINKELLNKALSKAYYLLSKKRDEEKRSIKKFESFSIINSRSKALLKLSDVIFVHSDDKDARNKHLIMRDGSIHHIKSCTFEHLVAIAPGLVRINVSEMILMELVRKYDHETVTINFPAKKNKVKKFILSRAFRKGFHDKLSLL